MQIADQIGTDAPKTRRMSPADYSAMKEKVIHEARRAQAAAIRAAFVWAIAAVAAFAIRSPKGAAAISPNNRS